MSEETMNIPAAGGNNAETERLAATFTEALKPAVKSFEDAGSRVLNQAKSMDLKVRALDLGEFTIKGGVCLGLFTAGGFIVRSLWRNRNAHLSVD